MKKAPRTYLTLAAIILGATCTASAQTFLLDFNTTAGDGGPNGIWNVYAGTADINGGVLLNSAGVPSLLTLSKSGTMTDSGNGGPATIFDNTVPDSLPSWVTSSTDNRASGDYFFTAVSATADTFTLTIANLTPGSTFSLDLLASRNDANLPGGLYEYSLGGGVWTGFTVLNSDGSLATTADWNQFNTQTQAFNNKTQGYDLHRYMNVSNVTLTGTTLQIRVTDSALEDASINTSYTVLNAVRLSIVPEPSMFGLLGLGVGGLLARRRRG